MTIKEVLEPGPVHKKNNDHLQDLYLKACFSLLQMREIIGKNLFKSEEYLISKSKNLLQTLKINDPLSSISFYLQIRLMIGDNSSNLKDYVLSKKYFDPRKMPDRAKNFVLENADEVVLMRVSADNTWKKYASHATANSENRLVKKALIQNMLSMVDDYNGFVNLFYSLNYNQKLNLMHSIKNHSYGIRQFYADNILMKRKYLKSNPKTFQNVNLVFLKYK